MIVRAPGGAGAVLGATVRVEDLPVNHIAAPSTPPAAEVPCATRKILILWAIVLGVTLVAMLVCLRPLTEFIFINSPQNYAERARSLLRNQEPAKAVEHLMTIVRFLPLGEDTEAYQLLSEAWSDLGQEAQRDLWLARAEFQDAWVRTTPKTAAGLSERWDAASVMAASAATALGADLGSLPPQWIERMAEKMLDAKAREGAPVRQWIQGRTAAENCGLLLAGGAGLVLSGQGMPLEKPVLLQSAGFDQGKGAVAVVGDTPLFGTLEAGYHLVSLNPSTGEASPVRVFDTYANRSASQRMVEYIEDVPTGWMVLMAISDEGTKLADAILIEKALGSVGIDLPRYRFKKRAPGYREPFAGLGLKGGKGIGLIGERWGRPVTILAVPRVARPAVTRGSTESRAEPRT